MASSTHVRNHARVAQESQTPLSPLHQATSRFTPQPLSARHPQTPLLPHFRLQPSTQRLGNGVRETTRRPDGNWRRLRIGKYETKQHLAAHRALKRGECAVSIVYTHRGARTHDHKVKGLALCRLSYAGCACLPTLFPDAPFLCVPWAVRRSFTSDRITVTAFACSQLTGASQHPTTLSQPPSWV